MAWFKVDDKLWGHPKWIGTPLRARGLWITAGSWCASLETDGKIPAKMLAQFGATKNDAEALIESRLWKRTKDGYMFHGWADFQPTRAQKEVERAESAERMRRARAKIKHERDANVRANDSERTDTVTSTPTRPDPTRPDPLDQSPSGGTSPKQGRAKSAPQNPCGKDHDTADACGACGSARKANDKAEADAARAKTRRDREADAEARRLREAEAATVEPVEPGQAARIIEQLRKSKQQPEGEAA